MKVAFLLNSVSRNSGGLFEICRRLAQVLAEHEDVRVLGVEDRFTNKDLPAWAPVVPDVFRPAVANNFGLATGYAVHLLDLNPDIAHVHALWIYPSLVGYRWHLRTGRPLMYTAHGMLDSWAVRNSGWKKQFVRMLWEDKAHQSAACIQVNSDQEYRTVREYGLRKPICVIPNGIDIPSKVEGGKSKESDRKTLLYLGRLHPKKNLGALLEAWAQSQISAVSSQVWQEWRLVIAGWDQAGYERELRRMKDEWSDWDERYRRGAAMVAEASGMRAYQLGLADSVSFVGPKFGEEKAEVYRNADAFILPSLSEGLPMVVLEAWAYGKPVVMSPECNLPEGFAAEAGLQIGTTPDAIAAGINQLMEMSDRDRQAMGARGRALVKEKFSWPKIGEQMRAVYQWVLGGGTPPECIRLK